MHCSRTSFLKISKDNTSQYENNRTYPALLLGHVGGTILADLVLDNLALPLVDDLALCLGVGGAHLLHDGGALVLVAGGALLVELGGAFLLVDGLLHGPGHAHALQLGDVVALLLEVLVTLLPGVLGLLAVLLVLEAALSPGHGLLDRPLGDLALALLDVGAGGVGHLLALLLGHRLVLGPGHLLAHLLGHLPADGLGRGAHHGRRVELQGEVREDQEQSCYTQSLHGQVNAVKLPGEGRLSSQKCIKQTLCS